MLKNLYKVGMLIVAFTIISFQFNLPAYAQNDYEKWGRIAVEVAKENYPDAEISDYQYVGREEISAMQARDTFRLQVKEDQRTFQINVGILFNPQTDRLISLSIEEVR